MKLINLFDGFGGNALVNFDNVNLDDLKQRNEVRIKEAKEKMGRKYLLHPENKVVKRQNQHL